jgi:hypothetical protein
LGGHFWINKKWIDLPIHPHPNGGGRDPARKHRGKREAQLKANPKTNTTPDQKTATKNPNSNKPKNGGKHQAGFRSPILPTRLMNDSGTGPNKGGGGGRPGKMLDSNVTIHQKIENNLARTTLNNIKRKVTTKR